MARAVSPVVAVVLLVAVTVLGTAGVATVATGLESSARSQSTPAATISVSAVADTQRIAVTHRGGHPLDLRNCSMRILVDGEPLAHQPPVPYFAAEGFRGTPTGAFNSGGDAVLDPGERASLQLASTNAPHFVAGDRVRVTIRRDSQRVTTATVRAS